MGGALTHRGGFAVNLLSQKSSLFLVISAFVFAMALPACGYSGTNKCDDDCGCTGACNDRDFADCYDTEDYYDNLADNAGCADQRSTYLDCYGTQFRCVDKKPDASGCSAELESYLRCAAK